MSVIKSVNPALSSRGRAKTLSLSHFEPRPDAVRNLVILN
jgi:hypothetical protein